MAVLVPYCAECLLLRSAARLLQIPSHIGYTALVYLHRFRQIHPAQAERIDWLLVAACLHVAGKVEEASASGNHLLNTLLQLLDAQRLQSLKAAFPDLVWALTKYRIPLSDQSILVGSSYYKAKDELLHAEQELLRNLRFEVCVDQPHKYLLNYCKLVRAPAALVKAATCILNDVVVHSCICLQHPIPLVASACLSVASSLLGMRDSLPSHDGRFWWDAIGHQKEPLDTVCMHVLKLLNELHSDSLMQS